jgi:hypothetical protein
MLLRAAATDVQGIFGDEQATAVARRAYRFCVAHHLDMSGIKEPSSLFYILEETTAAFKIVAGCLKACEFRIGVLSLEQKTQQAALSTASPPNGPIPLPPVATESVGSPSPFARLVQQQAAQRKRDAEAQAAWDEGVRRLQEFRALWGRAWERLLSNFDTNDKYRLVDANAAGTALAEVGALMNRLGEVRSDMRDCPATDRLRTLAESDQWRGDSPQTAAAILYEAAREIGADDLARVLTHAEGDPGLRPAFGWLEFYRDRLLSQPGRTHPSGFIDTAEALPVVECHRDDIRFAELWLCGLPPRADLIQRAAEELQAMLPAPANATDEEPEPAQEEEADEPPDPEERKTRKGRKKRKSGRPERTENDPEVKKENQLYRDWKASGLPLPDFLRERSIEEKEGRMIIDRARKRVEKPRN